MTGVVQFYEGQNIFVTGATGFLGKVLLEKLLRACPDVGNIFVLVRPKKGKEPSERVQNIISLPVITKESFFTFAPCILLYLLFNPAHALF